MALAMSVEAAQPPSMPSGPVPSSSQASVPAASAAALGAAGAPTQSQHKEAEALHPSSAGAENTQSSTKVCLQLSHCGCTCLISQLCMQSLRCTKQHSWQ